MKTLSRRTLLRSGSAAILLPMLESDAFAKGAATPPPKRLVFLPMGYGVNAREWFPDVNQVGSAYDLPASLKPFEELKSDLTVIQNLSNRHAVNGHTGTTHFLTSANVRAIKGVTFKNTVSCDQVAAELLGKDTRHPSLAIARRFHSTEGHGTAGIGYASWSRSGKPVGTYQRLTDLYAALFGGEGMSEELVRARLARKQSSLDALVENAKRLNHKISATDRDRVDEYFTTIRSIENRLSKAQDWVNIPYPKAPFALPREVSGTKELELTFDLMHAAIQSDSTRVMTYCLPTSGILKEIKSPFNAHKMSHHGIKPAQTEIQLKRDLIFSEQVARFLNKLKATKEIDGSSLLDHSLIAYGTCLRQTHTLKNGPLILAGHGGGGLTQGRNLVYKSNTTPLSNLWLSMLRHVGVEQDRFADSNGVLSEMGFS